MNRPAWKTANADMAKRRRDNAIEEKKTKDYINFMISRQPALTVCQPRIETVTAVHRFSAYDIPYMSIETRADIAKNCIKHALMDELERYIEFNQGVLSSSVMQECLAPEIWTGTIRIVKEIEKYEHY